MKKLLRGKAVAYVREQIPNQWAHQDQDSDDDNGCQQNYDGIFHQALSPLLNGVHHIDHLLP